MRTLAAECTRSMWIRCCGAMSPTQKKVLRLGHLGRLGCPEVGKNWRGHKLVAAWPKGAVWAQSHGIKSQVATSHEALC